MFVVVSPFLQRWVSTFTRARDAETIRQLLRIEQQEPLTKEQADRLRKQLQEERARRLAEVDELKAENDELRQQLDTAARVAIEQKKVVAKEGDEGPASAIPLEQAPFKFLASDFISVEQRTVIRLIERGLQHREAAALYLLRNNRLLRSDWAAELGVKEPHEEKVMVDRLKGLELIEETIAPTSRGQTFLRITSAGSQALDAMTTRGFISGA